MLDLADDHAVEQGEAFQDAADGGGGIGGHGLAGLAAEGGDLGGHVAGGEEALVVGVDEGDEAGGLGGLLEEGFVADFAAGLGPFAAALLDDP